jgi:hypothetical protein
MADTEAKVKEIIINELGVEAEKVGRRSGSAHSARFAG